jgi:hypothetical protein
LALSKDRQVLDLLEAQIEPSRMQIEELRKLTGNGFRPFILHLTDGRWFDVPHPDFIALSRRMVVVIGQDELPNLIDPLHIVSAKPKEHPGIL